VPPASGQKILMAAAYFAASVLMYQTARRHIPEHCNLGKKKNVWVSSVPVATNKTSVSSSLSHSTLFRIAVAKISS